MPEDDSPQVSTGVCTLPFVIWNLPSGIRHCPSVIKQELAAVEQRPEDVLEDLCLVGALAQQGPERRQLLGGRSARQAAEVEVDDPFLGVLPGGLELGDDTALLDLGVDRVTVEQVEGLRQR